MPVRAPDVTAPTSAPAPTSSTEAAPPTRAAGDRAVSGETRRRRVAAAAASWAPALAGFALLTGISWLLFFQHAYIQYDTVYALAWGQDLAHGRLPQLEAPNAPTPHPLGMLQGLLATLLVGHAADEVMLVGTVLGFALVVWGVYLLGARAFDARVGVLSALLIATSYPLLLRAGASFFDVSAVGLAVIAGAMEAKRPRRGLPVLLVLVAAGLVRPEAWLLSAVYLAYLAPAWDGRRLARAALVAAIAPALWLGTDFALTGDPLHSFIHTQAQLSAADEDTTQSTTTQQAQAPLGEKLTYTGERFGVDLRDTVRLPVIAGALLGLAFALLLARRGSRVPLVLLALGTLTYLCLGLAGLYLMERFTFLAASMMVIFCSFAAVGWIGRDLGGPLRWGWIGAGVLVILVLAGTAPDHAKTLPGLRDAIATRSAMTVDLERLSREPAAAAAFDSCASVTVQNYRGRPHMAYLIDRDPAEIDTSPGPPPSGAYVVAATPEVEKEYLRHSPGDPLFAKPPFDGFREVAANGSFVLFTKGCGSPG